MTTKGGSHVNEDITNSNLQSNIVESSVTVTIGEDEPSVSVII